LFAYAAPSLAQFDGMLPEPGYLGASRDKEPFA